MHKKRSRRLYVKLNGRVRHIVEVSFSSMCESTFLLQFITIARDFVFLIERNKPRNSKIHIFQDFCEE